MQAIEARMLKARVGLLLDQPFFGQIIMHLQMQEASGWCKTAATDGKHFFYNPEFIDSLTDKELLFVHGHEVLHVILDHVYRKGDRNKPLWGMAIDYLVNYILKKNNIGEMPAIGLYDKRYSDNFSAEQIYELLEQTVTKIQQTLDQHIEGSGSEAGDAECDNDLIGQSGQPKMSQAEAAEARATMRSVIMQAHAATEPGKVPAGIKRLLDKMFASKINWRQMLVTTLRSTIKYDYTYTRLSRRTWSSGLILPGQDVTERVEVTGWLDGSGSTTQPMVTDFLKECKGIMKSFRDFELRIGSFDTEVYNVVVYTPDNANEIDSYEFRGGGGTRPSCCWEYMKKHRIKPDRLLIFTDGLVRSDWGDEDYADTLFIIHGRDDIVAPYGRTVVYEA